MKRAIFVISLIVLILLSVVSVQAEFGTNWTAAFYDNTTFSGEPVETLSGINGLNFNWPEWPTINGQQIGTDTRSGDRDDDDPNNIGRDGFSVRFTSTQTFNAGTYRFDIAVDDNIRVFIDNEEVFEDFSGGPVKTRSFTRVMTAGQHTLRVDFVEVSEAAVLQFQWFPENIAPTSVVPTATPIPPLTASVSSSVRGLAVRTGPYLGATLVTVAIPGEQYPVRAQNSSEAGVTWYQIDVAGHTGWSSGRYLNFNTEPGGLGVAGSIFDTLGSPAETGVFAEPRAVMNMRAQPSTRTPIIDSIPWGARMPLYNRTVQGGQDRWYQVRYEGQIGWIFAPYVSVSGDIRDVPVR